MLKISAVVMLGAVALPSVRPDRPASEMAMTMEAMALELGFRMDLVEELTGRKCTCTCDFESNDFPLTFSDCNFGITSLTETVACGGGASNCTISGNMTWTPDCGPPCCGTAANWLDGANGSQAFFTDLTFFSTPGTFASCTPGNFFGSTGSSFQTACDAPNLWAVAGVEQCNGSPLGFQGITWTAVKRFSCNTVGG